MKISYEKNARFTPNGALIRDTSVLLTFLKICTNPEEQCMDSDAILKPPTL